MARLAVSLSSFFLSPWELHHHVVHHNADVKLVRLTRARAWRSENQIFKISNKELPRKKISPYFWLIKIQN